MSGPAPDTHDLRSGPGLHDALLALLPLVGRWQGEGAGVSPVTGGSFRFAQRVTFAHDGRPFLVYSSRSWLLEDDGSAGRPAWRESGFWRPGDGADDVEAVLASNTGEALVLAGTAGDRRWDLASTAVVPTPSAVPVAGERRLYAVRDERLVYATELASAGQPYAAHLNAALVRVPAADGPGPG